MPGERRWHKRGGIIKKIRNEEGVTKMNRHRNGGLCISFSQIEHTGEHFQTVHVHGSTNTKKKSRQLENDLTILRPDRVWPETCATTDTLSLLFMSLSLLASCGTSCRWRETWVPSISPILIWWRHVRWPVVPYHFSCPLTEGWNDWRILVKLLNA